MYRESAAPETCKHGYRDDAVCPLCIKEAQDIVEQIVASTQRSYKKSIIDVKFQNKVRGAFKTLIKYTELDNGSKIKSLRDEEREEIAKAVNSLRESMVEQEARRVRDSILEYKSEDHGLIKQQKVLVTFCSLLFIIVVVLCIL